MVAQSSETRPILMVCVGNEQSSAGVMSSPLTSSPTPLFCPLQATPTTRITHGPKVRSSHFPSPALPLHSHHHTPLSQKVFLKYGQLYFSRAGAVNIAGSPGICPICEGDSGGFLQVFKSLNPRKLNGVCIQCIVCKLSHSCQWQPHYYCYVPPCFTFVPLCTPVEGASYLTKPYRL